jgi:hypothetical protein
MDFYASFGFGYQGREWDIRVNEARLRCANFPMAQPAPRESLPWRQRRKEAGIGTRRASPTVGGAS